MFSIHFVTYIFPNISAFATVITTYKAAFHSSISLSNRETNTSTHPSAIKQAYQYTFYFETFISAYFRSYFTYIATNVGSYKSNFTTHWFSDITSFNSTIDESNISAFKGTNHMSVQCTYHVPFNFALVSTDPAPK